MKLSQTFDAVAYKQLVAVDLPNRGSHQHELNGVSALKSVFGTAAETRGRLVWVHFPAEGEPVQDENAFTFYDARARSSARTGRSEWRLYYHGDFLLRAKVADLFVLVRTRTQRLIGMVFQRGSAAHTEVVALFGLDVTTSFDSLPMAVLETREWDEVQTPILAGWFDIRADLDLPATPLTPPPTQRAEAVQVIEPAPIEQDGSGFRRGDLAFKPRARMLMLLGDQLIRDAGIAVFELVKNAYDADATEASVTLSHVTDSERGRVFVEDNGCGMSWEQIVNIWLEPGTDYRKKQKQSGYRTPRFHRLPLGEKGVGRFAAHKLGRYITVITRQKDSPEVVVSVDWDAFLTEKYLSGTLVSVKERAPQYFTGESTGTRIEISKLNEELSRGTIRQIHRSVNSITSPFRGPADFTAKLEVVPSDASLATLLNVDKVLELAPYRATCLIDTDTLTYDYDFVPPSGLQRIEGRSIRDKKMSVPSVDLFSRTALAEMVGPLLFELRIYDLDAQILQYSVTDKKGFKEFLRNNGGIRVYRDGVRVYDYGEPGNDWLDLGGSRVNQPTGRISNNQIIAAVHLEGKRSSGLIEKTNREGFIEDTTYWAFREAVRFAMTQVVFERNQDKQRLRTLYSGRQMKQPVLSELAVLRNALKQLPNGAAELLPMVDEVETQYIEMRDTLMTAAGAGLTLSIVIHEVEKAIKGLALAVEREATITELRDLATHLNELVDGLTYLTRKTGRKSERFGVLIKQAMVNTKHRTRAHSIEVIDGVDAGDPDISVTCTRRLIIATLMNLLDNSIFWLDTQRAEDRRIYIGSSEQVPGGPVLFVADTGPGFQDAPENLVQPFMSRRPEGMGLGLHVADLVMKAHDGQLIFPTAEDLGLSDTYSGAIVGLQFKQP